ncbi:MAG: peptidase S11 [Gammaproteobacteria bacterium]|nr:peptidase S11 [Gammaproteobacteria bacterium]
MKKFILILISYVTLVASVIAAVDHPNVDNKDTINLSFKSKPRQDYVAKKVDVVLAQFQAADLAASDYVPATALRKHGKPSKLFLRSHIAVVYDERDNEVIINRSANKKVPIASITKLVTAMVLIDAKLPMDEPIQIVKADKDRLRYSKSRLPFGTTLTRIDLLLLALSASANRAAVALARTYPGGSKAFITAMNNKAFSLGLSKTTFADAAGLRNENTSTAVELVKLVNAASKYPLIRELTTTRENSVIDVNTGRVFKFRNTNRLIRKNNWEISLSKTGFTSDAGNCLVMKIKIGERPLILILLNSWGKLSKYGDSNRIKKWLIKTESNIRRLDLL